MLLDGAAAAQRKGAPDLHIGPYTGVFGKAQA
jgi:hypothetical protein